jgi:serine phosphatase RsbU (regulator of sigma subunit)
MPIRQEMMDQLAPRDQWANLSDTDRQKIISQVNDRMLGIEQGIRLGTDAAQKKIADAQRAADSKAQEIASAAKKEMATASATGASSSGTPLTSVAPDGAPSAPSQRKTAISGNKLNVTVEQNGQVVNQLNADVNLPNLLATVFSTTRRDRGELPFAVGKDGHIYTPTAQDLAKVQSLGPAATSASTPPGTAVLSDWIVVTTNDPTGTGLKFGIARPVGSSLTDLRRAAARNAGFGLGFICLALIGMVPLSSRLTRNLSRLSDGVGRIAQGDYQARVRVASHDEIGQLAQAFNKMAADVERHQHAAVEQERIKRELELGRQIQHDMLPQEPLRLGPTEIRGVSVPAREVGGDFFNYFQLDSGQVALLVGDVSGKGVGAALLMANIQAALRTRLAMGQGLASLADAIDLDVEANTPGPVYATLFVGIFDPTSRLFNYINAGHHPQFVLRDGSLLRMSSTGLPVGLLAGRGYTEDTIQLRAGDLLFFYTDGCVEAQNSSGDMFGAERLEALLESSTAKGADDVLARVELEISNFRSGYELYDDATMMAVRIG